MDSVTHHRNDLDNVAKDVPNVVEVARNDPWSFK